MQTFPLLAPKCTAFPVRSAPTAFPHTSIRGAVNVCRVIAATGGKGKNASIFRRSKSVKSLQFCVTKARQRGDKFARHFESVFYSLRSAVNNHIAPSGFQEASAPLPFSCRTKIPLRSLRRMALQHESGGGVGELKRSQQKHEKFHQSECPTKITNIFGAEIRWLRHRFSRAN